jgi:hypothetical protein
LNTLTTGAISYDLAEFSTKSANPNGQNREGKSMFAIAEVGVWFDLFHHGPHHIDATLPKVRTFGWVAIKNQESTGSRDTIRPAATAAISSHFAPHFYSEFTNRFGLLRVLADGLNSRESDYAVSPPIIRRGICDIALGTHDQAWAIPPRLGTCSSFCAVRA